MQKYGEQYIDCVMLSGPWYNEYFPKYKSAYEGQAITIPAAEDMVADHRRVHLVKGQPRMDDKRDKGEDGFYRHGDSCVAGVLAWAATTEEGEPGAGTTAEPGDIREVYQPSHSFGRSIARLFSRLSERR